MSLHATRTTLLVGTPASENVVAAEAGVCGGAPAGSRIEASAGSSGTSLPVISPGRRRRGRERMAAL
jgi:hypothetical protein